MTDVSLKLTSHEDITKKLANFRRNVVFTNDSETMKANIYNTDLSEDSPYFLYFGREAEKIAKSLRKSKVKLCCLTSSSKVSSPELVEAAKEFVRFFFRKAGYDHSRAVYFCGHEIGCSLIMKILEDRRLLEELPSLHLLSGIFLLAGVYNHTHHMEYSSVITGEVPIPKEDAYSNYIKNIICEQEAFDCRIGCSPMCDSLYEPRPMPVQRRSKSMKLKKTDHGAEFYHTFSMRSGTVQPKDLEFPFLKDEDLGNLYSLPESFLKILGVRVYIIAASKDGKYLVKQSRDVYERLSKFFDRRDMLYEVKFGIDGVALRTSLYREDNFLNRLVDFDINQFVIDKEDL